MNSLGRIAIVLGAAALGVGLSASLGRSVAFRDQVGQIFKRGHLVAVTNGTGIYEADLAEDESDSARSRIISENLRARAAGEAVSSAEVQHEFDLLRSQFGTEKLFRVVMRSNGFSDDLLKQKIAEEVRGRSWLTKQIDGRDSVSDSECRAFYAAHPKEFVQPVRFHVAHLFLAAPEAAPEEVIAEKGKAIAGLSDRITQGADFAQLAAEASEDEATKKLGGDLGFVSAWRMPPEFIEEIAKLKSGESSRPFRSHLGFHLARLLELRPAIPLPYETVRPEIAAVIRSDKRSAAADAIAERLSLATFRHARD